MDGMMGISIVTKGVGDALQFSSVPENYFKTTGKKILDVSRNWFFDYNPYVIRDESIKPVRVVDMWNFSPMKYNWPNPRLPDQPKVYLSNAEIHASVWQVEAHLIRPRLYRYETFPFSKREKILLHIDGKSHGQMPIHVIQHVIDKYKHTGQLYQIGTTDFDCGIPRIHTETLWDLAKVISEARMLIGMDSGPSWIAACYPDVIVKKLKNRNTNQRLETWVPLDQENIHAHWDDRCHQIYNPTDRAIGFMDTYRNI